VNGVVWAQVVVGTTVYATGSFTSARPAGAAAGTGETARSNLIAYDLRTGALVTTWAPALNAQGLAIAASPDGTRIYVAGDFTAVNGVARYRMAALDARTGALVTSFAPRFDARVRALAVTASRVYAGGIFTTASGLARSRLAAMSAADGSVLPWAPGADAEVMALTVPAGGTKVVVAGRFAVLAGVWARGTGAVDATTGAALPWAMNGVVMDSGRDSAILSLSNDGATVYGTGYVYGAGGNLEGAFAARASDGAIVWINNCKGDQYGIVAAGGVVYSVGHSHDCSFIGGFPQTEPWTFQRAMAVSTAPSATQRNSGGTFLGRPAPDLLHWLPTLAAGTYTGQSQAAWSVAATSDYVVIGGEFPKVNGVPQQGLARFAIRAVAPNHDGPQGGSQLTPTLTGVRRGTVAVRWTAAWDRDNTRLGYEVLRGDKLSEAVVVGTLTREGSNWWTRPALAVTDATAPPGTTATYRIRVTDPLGNVVVGNKTTTTVPIWP
jgi:hypothetical protein